MTRVDTTPYDDQRPGTSGLRKKVTVFQQTHYLENFVQCILEAAGDIAGKTLVVGGDGRYHNAHAVQVILRLCAGNGVGRVIVGKGGLLSTPAASHLIRSQSAHGGIILSASHNPGGPDADFGIKYNTGNGGPAPESVTNEIFERSQAISAFYSEQADDIDLDTLATSALGNMAVEVVDPVDAYAELMGTLFDFDLIREKIADNSLSIVFDAMNAITGPYARRLLVDTLGAPDSAVLRSTPLTDFGGAHPDHLIKGYQQGIVGVARSMPTSRAADRVAESLELPAFETPTGWKFFGNLLDDGRITLCGEESFGTGSDHVREKDGVWAVLFWLNLLAVRECSVREILVDHWQRFGRDYYTRHDFENLDSDAASTLMQRLESSLDSLVGKQIAGQQIAHADNFAYHDPVDGSESRNQGIRIRFEDGARIVYRLSGTGTAGATLRVYIERAESRPDRLLLDPQLALADLIAIAGELADIRGITGRERADVVT